MGNQTLITIEAADLASIERRLADLAEKLDSVILAKRPEWVTVKDYAASIGRSERTVQRYIEQGRVPSKEECGVTLVKALG